MYKGTNFYVMMNEKKKNKKEKTLFAILCIATKNIKTNEGTKKRSENIHIFNHQPEMIFK